MQTKRIYTRSGDDGKTQLIKGKAKIVKDSMLASEGFIKLKSIAQKTGYSVDAIRRYTKNHKVDGQKHSNTWYYHKEIVEDIIRLKESGKGIST